MNRFWILLLFLAGIAACRKAPTRSLPDLSAYPGQHIGLYLERSCAPPFGILQQEAETRAELTILRPEFLAMTIRDRNDLSLWTMECRYIRDSLFYIDPFSRHDTVWHGQLVFADSLYLTLARRNPPCLHLGDTVSSVIFRALL